MKKLLKNMLYMAAFSVLMFFTGCTPRQPPAPGGPVVEIIERTDLLDSITIDHIVAAEKREKFKETDEF